MNKSEWVWVIGLIAAVSGFLTAHGLHLDWDTFTALAGIVFAYLKQSPFPVAAAAPAK